VITQLSRVNFYEGAGPLSYLIRRELESARPHLSPFERLFGTPVRDGKLSIQEAINAYLEMPQAAIEAEFAKTFKK
jgi:hypothetical protein